MLKFRTIILGILANSWASFVLTGNVQATEVTVLDPEHVKIFEEAEAEKRAKLEAENLKREQDRIRDEAIEKENLEAARLENIEYDKNRALRIAREKEELRLEIITEKETIKRNKALDELVKPFSDQYAAFLDIPTRLIESQMGIKEDGATWSMYEGFKLLAEFLKMKDRSGSEMTKLISKAKAVESEIVANKELTYQRVSDQQWNALKKRFKKEFPKYASIFRKIGEESRNSYAICKIQDYGISAALGMGVAVGVRAWDCRTPLGRKLFYFGPSFQFMIVGVGVVIKGIPVAPEKRLTLKVSMKDLTKYMSYDLSLGKSSEYALGVGKNKLRSKETYGGNGWIEGYKDGYGNEYFDRSTSYTIGLGGYIHGIGASIGVQFPLASRYHLYHNLFLKKFK